MCESASPTHIVERTGKQCVFVESPSNAGLKRALRTLAPPIDSPETTPSP